MALYAPPTIPTSGVLITKPNLTYFYKIKTAANTLPGSLVKYDTSNVEVVTGTDDCAPVGFLGYDKAHGQYLSQLTNIATAYSANDFAPVHFGGGFMISSVSDGGTNYTPGQLLSPGATGYLKVADAITATVAAGTTAVTSTSATPAITATGVVADAWPCAISYCILNNSAAALRFPVLSLI